MIKDIIRIPIYQGDFNAEGTNPVLNNFITEVIITGESLPALLPENSDVDITIKVDRSQLMKFTAYFPLLNHTEELEIEIKQTEPPAEELLTKEIAKAKRTAQKVNANDISQRLEELETQLGNEGVSADGKLKIQDSLRKELLKLDSAEKIAEWPKVEQELKEAFYDFEDLIQKIKANGDDEDINLDKVETHIQEYKKTIEQIIKEKDTKSAKYLTEEIDVFERELRNSVSGGLVDKGRIEYHDREFNNLQWKDKNKARVIINQGLKLISEGNTSQLRPILHQIWDLRIDPSGDDGTTLS
jgi:molecular chaperone DnaK